MIEYLNSGTIITQIGFYKEIYKVMGLAQKLFGTHSEHELKRIYPIADKIESYRESYGRLSDEELKGKTKEFKDRLAKGETLEDILPEAFATVREAGRRVIGIKAGEIVYDGPAKDVNGEILKQIYGRELSNDEIMGD